MPHSTRPSLPVRLTRAIVLLLAALWLASLAAVMAWERRDDAKAADAIVVLGAAQYDGRPSPVLRARLDHAVALWEQHLAPHLILTGGMGDGDTTSEAAVGRRYAVKHGVPDSAIYLSMERNMKCAVGLCGHCQFSGSFVCKDGPVYSYDQVRPLLGLREI